MIYSVYYIDKIIPHINFFKFSFAYHNFQIVHIVITMIHLHIPFIPIEITMIHLHMYKKVLKICKNALQKLRLQIYTKYNNACYMNNLTTVYMHC